MESYQIAAVEIRRAIAKYKPCRHLMGKASEWGQLSYVECQLALRVVNTKIRKTYNCSKKKCVEIFEQKGHTPESIVAIVGAAKSGHRAE